MTTTTTVRPNSTDKQTSIHRSTDPTTSHGVLTDNTNSTTTPSYILGSPDFFTEVTIGVVTAKDFSVSGLACDSANSRLFVSWLFV